jgi:alcohol dehydrogenase class IV
MFPFSFNTPTRITFSENSAATVGDVLTEQGRQRPLVVSDSFLVDSSALAPILTSLSDAGIRETPVFKDVPPDSDVCCVQQAVALARQNGCDSIIAVGGGSVIDTAKAINIGLSLGGDFLEFEGINCLPGRLFPFIAVPTTAGTGSEVSAVAMIKDRQAGKKLLFGSRFLFADDAVLDPTLLVGLPPQLTAATGLDAVTHALESYVAVVSNPFSESLALQALCLLMTHLPRATRCGDDLEARAGTLVASTMAGMSFSNAGVGIVHALAHSLGAKYSIHHGLANAIFLPHGMAFNMETVQVRYASVWRCLCTEITRCAGGDPHLSAKFMAGSNERESANLLVNAVKDLLNQCALPTRLRDAGVPAFSDADLHDLADMALTDPAIMFNPKEATCEELIDILKEAY